MRTCQISLMLGSRAAGDKHGIVSARPLLGIDSFAWYDLENGTTSLMTGHEALATLKCLPMTEALVPFDEHDAVVQKLISEVVAKNLNSSGRLVVSTGILWNRIGDSLEAHTDPRFRQLLMRL